MDNFTELTKILAQVNDAKLMKKFMEAILTEAELTSILARWELVKRLDRGESQRQIATDLQMSLCKITRGSKELKKRNSAFKKLLNIQKTIRKNP
ncbi:MAG: transcriptional regulator [Caldithrix sp.]|nr:transcriptional regulator [Caldithrix sp.]